MLRQVQKFLPNLDQTKFTSCLLTGLSILVISGCSDSTAPPPPEQSVESQAAEMTAVIEPTSESELAIQETTATSEAIIEETATLPRPPAENPPTVPVNTPAAEEVPAPATEPAPSPTAEASTIEPEPDSSAAGYALRFFGTGSDDVDRVKIRVDDPTTNEPGPPADIGATDFTLEWWMRAELSENPADPVECGPNNVNWIYGNVLFDRDRYNQDRKFGVSLAGGRIVFGVSGAGTGDYTLCGTNKIADSQWHHIAVQRGADGQLWIFVDGRLEANGMGPAGDISYPDDAQPGDFCSGPCLNSDPFLVIGAEKHDAGSEYPSFNGWLDEVRLSTTLRYESDFDRPTSPFQPDSQTAALWHFDEGTGAAINDASAAGQNVGLIQVGGPQQGPQWVISDAPLGQ